jgi:chromosomal replication initiation ATPase DnaA
MKSVTLPATYLEQLAAQLGITQRQLVGTSRRFADERRVAAWALREKYGLRLVDIAELLGYADHTTPRYHIRQVQARMAADAAEAARMRMFIGRRARLVKVWKVVDPDRPVGVEEVADG